MLNVLAVLIDCGLDWIEQLMDVFTAHVIGDLPFGSFSNDDDFSRAARYLLNELRVSEGGRVDDEDKYSRSILGILGFLTDNRFRSVLNWGRRTIRIQANDGSQALTQWTDPNYVLAIPACLSMQQFIDLDRLWVLERLGPGTWRIVNKARLLATTQLTDASGMVTLHQGQRVYGGSFWWEIDVATE